MGQLSTKMTLRVAVALLCHHHGVQSFSAHVDRPKAGVTASNRGATTVMRVGKGADESASSTEKKRIIFIRHGRTYMNDYINGIHYGQPGFTDVFPDTQENREKYYDSPLGPRGLVQVQQLEQRIRSLMDGDDTAAAAAELSLRPEHKSILDEVDLIVCSPLSRALQTMDQGLYPSLQRKNLPVVAVPHAAERIYLISDLGKSRRELKREYPYVDFDTAFPSSIGEEDQWTYVPTDEEKKNYVEWRPSGQGQVYACMGEPQDRFEERMERLITWLDSREESTIAVVCHGGVILWFLGEILDNCHVRVVDFENVKNPKRLYDAPKEQAAQLE